MNFKLLSYSLILFIASISFGASCTMFIVNGPMLSSIFLPKMIGSILICLAVIAMNQCLAIHCPQSLTFSSIMSTLLIGSEASLELFRLVSPDSD